LIVTLNSQPLEPERFIPLRWAETFYSASSFLLKRVLDVAGAENDPFIGLNL
jgi:hypothetical protein